MSDEEDKAPKRPLDPERQSFGQRLKEARERRKLTQADVAAWFDINKGTVSAWETGRGAPDAFTLKRLAEEYHITADSLLWDNSLSAAALKIAAQYDQLPEEKQEKWQAVWTGFIEGASQAPAPAKPATVQPVGARVGKARHQANG